MTIIVTGSAGHLGEALIRTLRQGGKACRGIDMKPSPYTDAVGSIRDREFVRRNLKDGRAVIHAATLHKPHIGTHDNLEFVSTNIGGTLILLEEAVAAGIGAFVYTSTTSAFGSALNPADSEPAAWITEEVPAVPKNIYGTTKTAAESLCEMFARRERLSVVILRTARFFPEPDDDPEIRNGYETLNAQANELLYRRVDLEDAVSAHLLGVERAETLGFGRYNISATTPFTSGDLALLREHAPDVVKRRYPEYADLFSARHWRMFARIDRVYVNRLAIQDLGWAPKYDFGHVLNCLRADEDFRSPLARQVGRKGYHDVVFDDGPYPLARK